MTRRVWALLLILFVSVVVACVPAERLEADSSFTPGSAPSVTTAGIVSYEMDPFGGGAGFAGAAVDGYESRSLAQAPAAFDEDSGNSYARHAGGVSTAAQEAVPAEDRAIIYTGSLTLRVGNTEETLGKIEELYRRLGGFVQNASLTQVTFRVPAPRFDEAMKAAQALGEVVHRDVSAADVTDQVADLELRLEVARTSHQRLLKLLETLNDPKAIVQVEQDLRRLLEEIERMEAMRRNLGDRIAYATITVSLQERTPQTAQYTRLPQTNRFPWLENTQLTAALADVHSNEVKEAGWMKDLFVHTFTLPGDGVPEGFVPLFRTPKALVATTPEDDRFRATLTELTTEADLDFWVESLLVTLRDVRGYTVEAPERFTLNGTEHEGQFLRSRAEFGGSRWLYDVWLIRRADQPDWLLVAEYARPDRGDEAQDRVAAVAEALRGVRVH